MRNLPVLAKKFYPFVVRLSLFSVLALVVLWAIGVGQASATIQVNSFEDQKHGNDGLCTLREAIIAANTDKASGGKPGECPAGSGADTIILPAGTYVLTRSDSGKEDASQTGDLDIAGDTTILGEPGVVISGDGINDRIFHIVSGIVSISGVTIQGGNVPGDGGGIYNSGTLALEKSVVTGNTASGAGGGIYNGASGTLTVVNSTVSGNHSGGSGGGIFNAGQLTLDFATIADNHAANDGGGVSNAGGATVAFGHTIIAGNDAAALPSDCSGVSTGSLGYNLVGAGTGCPVESTDRTVNPADVFVTVLGPLSFDTQVAAATRTHSLLPGSPAIDAIPTADCTVTTDQRGQPRPVDGDDGQGLPAGCDIGAFEAGIENIIWPTALELDLVWDSNNEIGVAGIDQYLSREGQSRWYKFKVQPNSRVIVKLTNLPANYNLFLFKDIGAAFRDDFTTLDSADDLTRLDAEFAADVFSSDNYSPDIYNPDIFNPYIFSPYIFSPYIFSPYIFSEDVYSPDTFNPYIFSADIFNPYIFSPYIFSPYIFSEDVFSPYIFSPYIFSTEIFNKAFASAQTRSLIGVSAFPGTSSEGIAINTWNNFGYYYIRVSANNGQFDTTQPFHVQVEQQAGGCGDVNPLPDTLPSSIITDQPAPDGTYNTIILYDLNRMTYEDGTPISDTDKANLLAKLTELANHSASGVNGVLVDLGTDNRVLSANSQADGNVQCPYAKNLVVEEIKRIIDWYWDSNPLRYVVLVGNDHVIPSERLSDQAGLANENNYVVPVLDNTASQASLRLGYYTSIDGYGARTELSFKNERLPIISLGVGRVVELPAEIIKIIDAYLANDVVTPDSAMVAGYDFLYDSATAIKNELEWGLGPGGTVDGSLITPAGPTTVDPAPWNADDLRQHLLSGPEAHDLIFLAGHFSASGALAADYKTRMVTSDVEDSGLDMSNSIIYSAGCHAGYNIVDAHDVPGVTREPDWAQVFARLGATLVSGHGYQYADTDTIEYSERLYLLFTQELRSGSGPVSVGEALARAKQTYLATTPQRRGIHLKSVLQASVFGLPMLSVDMPGARIPPTTDTPDVGPPIDFTFNPGLLLGLRYADLSVTPIWGPDALQTVTLTDPTTNMTYEATYLLGGDGFVSNAGEPILPLEVRNVTATDPNTGGPLPVRGVGFRGGAYADIDTLVGEPVLPLIGVPTTEVSGPHSAFSASEFHPIQPWEVNYFDALNGGPVRLSVTPAQYKAVTPGSQYSILRQFYNMDFRLFYSNYIGTFVSPDGTEAYPALAAPPTVVRVSAVPNGDGTVTFSMIVVGDPVAGMQEVWVTYTATSGPFAGLWQSLDLVQDPDDSTLWQGTLNLNGTNYQDVLYMVQAVNGVGLPTLMTNQGAFYVPGFDPDTGAPTVLSLDQSGPTSGTYGSEVTLQATLTTADGTPLEGQAIMFRLAGQTRIGMTDNNGLAMISMPLLGFPGTYEVRATFRGTFEYAASSAANTYQFTITPQTPNLILETSDGYPGQEGLVKVTVLDAIRGLRLPEMTVFIVLEGSGGTLQMAEITDFFGTVTLGGFSLPKGNYNVTVYFSDQIPSPENGYAFTLSDARYDPTMVTGSLVLLNQPPVAEDDAAITDEDTPVTIDVLANDSDVDGTIDAASVTITVPPNSGTASVDPATGQVTYTPFANFNGADSFEYQVCDNDGDCDTALVTITINPVNDTPSGISLDITSVEENQPVGTQVGTFTTSDPDVGDSHSYLLVDDANGSFIIAGDALKTNVVFDYETQSEYQIVVRSTDASGEVFEQAFTISILDANEPPDCGGTYPDPTFIWSPDKTFWRITLNGITDPDGDPLTVTIEGIYQDEPVGKGKLSPDGRGIGTDTAEVRAERDGNGDGRVYHVLVKASDGNLTCQRDVKIAVVAHDQSGEIDDIDQGPLYDSTVPGK